MKFDILFRRRWWLMYGPILLVAAVLLWLSYTQWLPQPPHQITIAAGQPGDGYTQIALRYRERLAQVGIVAEVTTNASSDLALQALLTEPPQAQLALVSGLHARTHLGSAQVPKGAVHAVPNAAPALQGLAVIEREPVWVFSRTPLMTKVSELRNMRVGIAAKDPLAKQVADLLIQNAGLKSAEILWIEVPRTQLANDLIDGKIDATIVLASAQSDAVRVLTRSPFIQIIGLEQVGDLTQRESRLRPFVLPQGVIEMRGDIPSRDLTMVAADLHW
ncbi:MAG: ABC transporter substrate-binding protein [Brachymonas sp.]|nr:ABC transporter substrate-binding protein [Brachymonas sp.]